MCNSLVGDTRVAVEVDGMEADPSVDEGNWADANAGVDAVDCPVPGDASEAIADRTSSLIAWSSGPKWSSFAAEDVAARISD